MLSNIMFGEVVASYAPSEDKNINKLRYEYDVRVFYQGSTLLLQNALMTEPLSGVDNFHEVVLRSSSDDDGGGAALFNTVEEGEKRPGDRVLVAIPNGNSSSPIIIATLPNTTVLPQDNGGGVASAITGSSPLNSLPALGETVPPQLRGRYNGFNYRIDEAGQFRLQHSGIASLKIEQGGFEGKEDAPVTEITTLDFLTTGGFRVVDNNRQGIVIDAANQFISLNNTTTAPDETFDVIAPIEIEEPNNREAPVGQELRLDQANETLSVLSSDQIVMISGGDTFIDVLGSQNENVIGDDIRTVGGDFDEEVSQNYSVRVAGGQLSYTVNQSMEFVSETGSSIVADASGNVEIKAVDGTTITMGPGGAITIESATSATITTTQAKIDAAQVEIGSAATLSAVLAEPLLTWLQTHVHPTAVGSSGPSPLPTAGIASTTVKVQP